MTDDSIAVDIRALEDFHATLATRRTEVEAVITKMNAELRHPPQLGAFADATQRSADVQRLHNQYTQRIQRLHTAIVTAQRATSTIIANYHANERLNSDNAVDIGKALDGVNVALDGGNKRV